MKRIGMNRKCMAAAMLAALPAQGALGQQSPGNDQAADPLIDEIIVTSTKREESIYDVPVSVSAFTEETILRQGITDLTDIGKFVPNLTVTGFSAGHVSSMNPFIRGIGLQDHLITTDPGVGVYVDGVYLGRQVGQNWSLANIERVEVLRGPQGTLYGRNTIGGAINIITRQPGEESGGRVTAQAGSRGRLGGDFYWNQAFTDSFAASFTGAYTQRDGVGEFRNHDAARDVGELEEWNVRAAAKWAPTEDFSLLFTYDMADGEGGLRPYYTRIDEVPNGLLYATGARNSDTASDPYDNNGGFYIDPIIGTLVDRSVVTNEADGWAVTADWNMSDALAWKFIYSDRSSDYESGLDDDSLGSIANPSRDSFGELLFPGTENGTVFSYPETGYADQQSAELQLFGDFGGWDFVAGLYQFEEEGGNRQDPNFFLGGPGVFINQQETESWALYGNVGFDVTDGLRLSVGARYTEDEKHAYTAPVLGVIEAESSRDWDEITDDLSASWDLTDRLNLYGTIQTGYQSGQYPARAYCLFGDPDCYVAGENVTARQLRNRPQGAATRQPEHVGRGVLHGLLRPALPGQQLHRHRLQHGQHHRRPGFAGLRVGKLLGADRQLPAARHARLHRRGRRASQPECGRAAHSGPDLVAEPGIHLAVEPGCKRDVPRGLVLPGRHVRRTVQRPRAHDPDREPRHREFRHCVQQLRRSLDTGRLRPQRNRREVCQCEAACRPTTCWSS